jgi:hypothetical protein
MKKAIISVNEHLSVVYVVGLNFTRPKRISVFMNPNAKRIAFPFPEYLGQFRCSDWWAQVSDRDSYDRQLTIKERLGGCAEYVLSDAVKGSMKLDGCAHIFSCSIPKQRLVLPITDPAKEWRYMHLNGKAFSYDDRTVRNEWNGMSKYEKISVNLPRTRKETLELSVFIVERDWDVIRKLVESDLEKKTTNIRLLTESDPWILSVAT